MKAKSPKRWANDLTTILNTVHGANRFPVDVGRLAQEYSREIFPHDPITLVQGQYLPNFDGALVRAPACKVGWGIIYNNAVESSGRIRFTLAHEFGHYLLHRLEHPDGIRCTAMDVVRWDSDYRKMEREANEFAAYLLMPFDDFRNQLAPRARPTLGDLGECAERYGVSLTAVTLRWLAYTERRSIVVASRDGFALWAWSSNAAFRSGAFIRTAGSPFEVPPNSIAAHGSLASYSDSVNHNAGVWLHEPCEEIAFASDRYDFVVSLLHLGVGEPRHFVDEGMPPELTGNLEFR